MRALVLGGLAGVLLLQHQPVLPAWPGAMLGLVLLLALLLARYGKRVANARATRLGYWLLCLLCAAALGFYWAATLAAHTLSQRLASELEGRDLLLQGVVSDLPSRFEGGERFAFTVEQVQGNRAAVPTKLILGWYDGRPVRAGERWQFWVRLQRPHGNANPFGFDYELWLLEQRVRATGYVREHADNRRLAHFVPGVGTTLAATREALRERIYHALPDARYAGVLVALVVGDQRAIRQSDWALFNQTGVGHLMSISGLHITMLAGLAAVLAGFLWRRSLFTGGLWPLYLPTPKVMALAAAGMAVLYVALAGFGIPAQRTLIMLLVMALALWLNRIGSVSQMLAVALALVLLFDPWAVLWPGFWLSFGAVGLIVYAVSARTARYRQRWQRQLYAGVRTQAVITLGLLPLTLLLFAQYSVIGPLANALAIPLISFVVTPLALLGSLLPAPLSALVLGLAHMVLQWLIGVLGTMEQWPLALWRAPRPDWPVFGLAVLGTLWLLAPRGWPVRWLGGVLCLPLLLGRASAPQHGQLWVTAFDVGQGQALLLETARHRLLFDAGPAYSAQSDGGTRVILPYLAARGITGLDGLIISHRDTDHAGGAASIVQAMPLGWLVSSLEAGHPLLKAVPQPLRCQAGQRWHWDGVEFAILHPPATSYAESGLKPNAKSCTLKVITQYGSILLPADLEAAQEKALVAQQPQQLKSDVLLVPHHGSGTSSSSDFLQAVAPKLAIVQVGWRNRYHHPKPEVMARYRQLGIETLRTDQAGAVQLFFAPQWQVLAYRRERVRYWQE